MEWDNCPDCGTRLKEKPVENCSCHINPPCSACTAPRMYCDCGWEEKPYVMNDYSCRVNKKGVIKSWKLRDLDPTRIDYHIKAHTNSSQICEGVCPPGTTMEQVLEKVRGTFGGRFEQFENGKFKYIAYTD